MSQLLSILHKNEQKMHSSDNYIDYEDSDEDYDLDREKLLVSKNFSRIVDELNSAKKHGNLGDKTETTIDPLTKVPMQQIDIGLKNFDVAGVRLDISKEEERFDNFAPNKKLLLIKFRRKNSKDIMSINEIKRYIKLNENGEVEFLRNVTPEIIYKITKSLNNEFYFIANYQDNVIPLSALQAEALFPKHRNFSLNSRMHVERIFDKEGNVQKPSQLHDMVHEWFGKNVRHMHPYAYSDMVITRQVKHYKFVKTGKSGRKLIIKTQFSNELTDKYISIGNIHKLKAFAKKCNTAFLKATNFGEEHVFALPFPLYSQHHMLSLVIAFKPDGKIKATIINANGRKDAKKRYAIPIGEILQRTFEKYAPNIAKNIDYFFHENNSQFGGTCMTHADCISRQLVKDPDFEYDGHELHPIKIWEKAYIRGYATTLYQHALRQGKFIPDDVSVVKAATPDGLNKETLKDNDKKMISNLITTDKMKRNEWEKDKCART